MNYDSLYDAITWAAIVYILVYILGEIIRYARFNQTYKKDMIIKKNKVQLMKQEIDGLLIKKRVLKEDTHKLENLALAVKNLENEINDKLK